MELGHFLTRSGLTYPEVLHSQMKLDSYIYLLLDLNKFSFWKREVPRFTKCYTLRRSDR